MIEATTARATNIMTLAATGTAPKMARLFAKATVRKWELADRVCEWAELVISELATNAIKATGTIERLAPKEETATTIKLRLVLLERSIVVEVEDADPTPPTMEEQTDDAESGRGMFIIETISSRWNHYTSEAGKVVWAELIMPAQHVAHITPVS